MELLTDALAAAAGLRRYEIANLARPGHESRHNLLYWRRRPHLAIGPGAHAFDGARTRSWNAAPLDAYLAALHQGHLPPGGRDVIDEATAIAETAILGLRLSEGIEASLAELPAIAPALDWARGLGLAEAVAGRTRLTTTGRLLADQVFERLVPGPPIRPRARMPASDAASA
jgi:oxygen-independent coproporphyrinogen-3 oxidase